MEKTKTNILLLGNSGAGKSTLLNAIFDSNVATTGKFGGGKTQKLKMYENEYLNYRIIDTKGMELGWLEQRDTINQVSNYIKDIIKEENTDAALDIVWYCVDATSKRFFKENVKQILAVYKKFPNVPIIVVLTKSYCALDERKENEQLIRWTFEQYDKKNKIVLSDVISVNSAPFRTANDEVISIFGCDKLVEKVNEILPEAKKTSERNMRIGISKIKNRQANITIAGCTTGAVAVGAVPIPFPDALALVPIQTGMVKAITKIYDVEASVISTALFDGALVSNLAKSTLTAVKAIPVLNLAAALLNAIVAGVFTVAIGEVTLFVCQKIDSGEVDRNNLKEIEEIVKDKLPNVIEKVMPQITDTLKKLDVKKLNVDGIKKIFTELLKTKN